MENVKRFSFSEKIEPAAGAARRPLRSMHLSTGTASKQDLALAREWFPPSSHPGSSSS